MLGIRRLLVFDNYHLDIAHIDVARSLEQAPGDRKQYFDSAQRDFDLALNVVRENLIRLSAVVIDRFRLANHMVGAEGAPALGLVIRISGRTTPPALVR